MSKGELQPRHWVSFSFDEFYYARKFNPLVNSKHDGYRPVSEPLRIELMRDGESSSDALRTMSKLEFVYDLWSNLRWPIQNIRAVFCRVAWGFLWRVLGWLEPQSNCRSTKLLLLICLWLSDPLLDFPLRDTYHRQQLYPTFLICDSRLDRYPWGFVSSILLFYVNKRPRIYKL